MRPSPAMVVALVALVSSLTGGAVAATLIDSSKVKNNSLSSIDIKDGSLTGVDLKNGSITGTDIKPGSVGLATINDGTSNTILFGETGAPGPAGLPGAPGTPGQNGANGTNGANGSDAILPPIEAQRLAGLDPAWSDFGEGHRPVTYYKDRDGWVHVRGVAKRAGGNIAEANTVLTLPEGYRPSAIEIFPAQSLIIAGPVYVRPNGVVEACGCLNDELLSLSGIAFAAG